jgi:hypothetical protein
LHRRCSPLTCGVAWEWQGHGGSVEHTMGEAEDADKERRRAKKAEKKRKVKPQYLVVGARALCS